MSGNRDVSGADEVTAVAGDSYCAICGKPGGQPPGLPRLPALDDVQPWRCHKCFAVVAPQHLYCPDCGDCTGHADADGCRQAYSEAGVVCLCDAHAGNIMPDGLQDIKHVVFAYLLFLLPVLIGTAISFHSETDDAYLDIIVTTLLYGIGLVFVVLNWGLIRPLLRLPQNYVLAAIVIPLLAAPVTVALALSQLVVFPYLAEIWKDYSAPYLEAGFGWSTVYLMIAVLPPIFEELMFRGVLLQRLRRVMTPWQAIIVTAMFFGILHLSAIGVVFFLVPLAVVAGWLTIRTGSIFPAIMLHFLHNATIVTLDWMGYQ